MTYIVGKFFIINSELASNPFCYIWIGKGGKGVGEVAKIVLMIGMAILT